MKPEMIVVAGPSGSGKSRHFGVQQFGIASFNIDDRCAALNGGSYLATPGAIRAQAQQECEQFINDCTAQRTSFAVETTLRTTASIEQAERARVAGFAIKMIFVATDDVRTIVLRVARRGLDGGHSAPAERIADIYQQSLGEGYLPGVTAIITTRVLLDDLEVAEGPYYRAVDVERIAAPACIELLRRRGVHGADTVLEAIAEACGRHALTVDLIGGYLAAFKGGAPLLEGLPSHDEIARVAADEPDRKRQAVARQSARFSRIAQRYREGLREHDPTALALMERICLFRTGVTMETLAAIFLGKGKESIVGKELSQLSVAELKLKLFKLREMRIIEYADDVTGQRRIQVHPAVREGFLTGLAMDNAGHSAIREHFASTLARADVALGNKPDSTPNDPFTQDLLEEMIHHSLEAGLVAEADGLLERLAILCILGGHERIERVCRLFSKGHSPSTTHRHGDRWEDEFFLIWGLAYQAMGQPALARVCYERYLLEDLHEPDESDSHRTSVVAFTLFIEGQLSRALQQFRRLLEAPSSELNASFLHLVSAFLDGERPDKCALGFAKEWAYFDHGVEILDFAVFARADLLVHLLVRAELLEAAEIVAENSSQPQEGSCRCSISRRRRSVLQNVTGATSRKGLVWQSGGRQPTMAPRSRARQRSCVGNCISRGHGKRPGSTPNS